MVKLNLRNKTLIFISLVFTIHILAGEKQDQDNKRDPFLGALDSAFLMYAESPTGAIKFAGVLFDSAVTLRNNNYILEAGMLYGDFLLQTGDAKNAHSVFYFLIDSLDHPVNDSVKAVLKKRQAYCNFYMGEFRLAGKNFEELLEYSKQKGDTGTMATAYTSLGAAYIRTGNFDKALENLQQSLICYNSLNDLNGEASALNNLGGVYTYLLMNDTAKHYFLLALEVNEILGDSLTMVALLLNIAGIERSQGNFTESLKKDLQALDLSEKILNKTLELETYRGVGMDYMELGDTDQAQLYLLKGLNKSLIAGSTYDEMHFRNVLGKVYLINNDFAKALELFLPGMEIAETTRNFEMLASFNNSISDVYAEMGDYKQAYDFYKSYHANYDSLYNERTRLRISELEMQYDNERKSAEIVELSNKYTIIGLEQKRDKLQKSLLFAIVIFSFGLIVLISFIYNRNRKTAIILQKKNGQLEEAVAVKTRLFSIVAHDLKNPLSAIIGFSGLLSDKKRDEHEVLDFAGFIKDCGMQSVEMIERLLDWSRLNLNEIPFYILENDLGKTADKALNDIKRSASIKNIQIVNNIPIPSRCFYDEYSVYSILFNLLSNAIKFSYEGSSISINVNSDDDTVTVSVIDEGTGIPTEIGSKLLSSHINHSRPGTDNEKGTGLGLSLSQEFVNRNGGRMWLKSEVGLGSTFYFTLPRSVNKLT
jgi:signal transduction histidine kinase